MTVGEKEKKRWLPQPKGFNDWTARDMLACMNMQPSQTRQQRDENPDLLRMPSNVAAHGLRQLPMDRGMRPRRLEAWNPG